ncbi:MAG: transposase [Deltaproteobacteria bacterium]|nr:MAG: transposase [Deltaproteobacteria bacterium]
MRSELFTLRRLYYTSGIVKLYLSPRQSRRFTPINKRYGTATLFAALDTATGTVLSKCYKRHRHQEFINLLNLINRNVPRDKDIHIITDNYSTHKHEKAKKQIKRGVFISAKDLVEKIETFIER